MQGNHCLRKTDSLASNILAELQWYKFLPHVKMWSWLAPTLLSVVDYVWNHGPKIEIPRGSNRCKGKFALDVYMIFLLGMAG